MYATTACLQQQRNKTKTEPGNLGYSSGTMYGPHLPTVPIDDAWKYTKAADGSIDYNVGNMYGSSTKNETKSMENASMDDEKKSEIQSLSLSDATSLRDIGCVIIKNGMRKDLIMNALKLINSTLYKGADCLKNEKYAKHNVILDLFNESAAFSLCQNVLGLTNVIIPKSGQIKLRFPYFDGMEETEEKDENIEKKGLMDDALCSMKMRMILSGQKFKFYKSTHVSVFEKIQKMGKKEFMNDCKMNKNGNKWTNELIEWEVSRGDIVLWHPFLCLAMSEESDTENIDYCVDFGIKHKDFDELMIEKRFQHLWLGYEQLREVLMDEKLVI